MTNAMIIRENNSVELQSSLNVTLIDEWIRFCDVKPETQKTYLKSIKQFYLYLDAQGIKTPSRDDVIHSFS